MAEYKPPTPLTFPSDLTAESNRYGNNRLCINIFNNDSSVVGAIATAVVTDVVGMAAYKTGVIAVPGVVAENFIPGAANRRSTVFATKSEYTIFLPMPLALDTNYSINYSEESVTDLGASVVGAPLTGAANILSLFKGKVGMIGKVASAALAGGPGPVAKTAAKLVGIQAGLSVNPHQELLLNGVKFREFKFSYDLIAKNKDDSDAIQNIIKVLKISMHPEIAAASLLFKYPSEFELLFYTTSTTQNPYLFKTKRCILKDLQVSYGKNFVTFKDTNAPVEISITMNFQETEILDRGSILADATGVTF